MQIRAAAAIFVQPGQIASASLTRPLDESEVTSDLGSWIDAGNSNLLLEASGRECGTGNLTSSDLTITGLAPELEYDGSYDATSIFQLNPCASDRTWRFHGHLRWNASTPYSSTRPAWITDSIDAWAEVSAQPKFLSANFAGPLELRWITLAQADSSTRWNWSRDPLLLTTLCSQWTAFQKARGLDPHVLALDTTIRPWSLQWSTLDTALLRAVLTGAANPEIVFNRGDTVWIPDDHETWIKAQVASTGADQTSNPDLYAASREQFGSEPTSFAQTPMYLWSFVADSWFILDQVSTDTAEVQVGILDIAGPVRIELALAGTCPGQRAWLHEGGSNRSQLPHGNVGPLDGFVCEVHVDTVSFPVGK